MNKTSILKIKFLGYVLATVLLFQPSEGISQKRADSNKGITVNHSTRNGKGKIHVNNNGNEYKIEYEGDITLSVNDKDITSISDGGFIEIERSTFGSRRRIVIEADRSGNLTKKYYVGRSEKNYEPEGREWLAEILIDVVRSTTLGAESRVQRFYTQGGAKAVIDEIKQIDSDYVESRYFSLLLEYDLNDSELVSVIETAGNRISSDHYLAQILKSNQKAFLSSGRTIDAYINACKSINSDHYITEVMKQVISDRSISDAQMGSLLDITKSIESDHYVTTVLTQIMDNRELTADNVAKVINLSKQIQSDHYKTNVLKKVINEKNMPAQAYDAFLETLDDINSDHYTAEVVMTLLDSDLKADSNSLTELLDIVKRNVNSDHYAANIFKSLANRNLTEDQMITALNATSNINSDHYMSEVLLAFASKVNRSSARVKEAYRTAAKSINSDSYYGKVAKAVD